MTESKENQKQSDFLLMRLWWDEELGSINGEEAEFTNQKMTWLKEADLSWEERDEISPREWKQEAKVTELAEAEWLNEGVYQFFMVTKEEALELYSEGETPPAIFFRIRNNKLYQIFENRVIIELKRTDV